MTQIQVRQDTAINWSSNSAITPASGEFCYQTDGDKFVKIGDGSTKFNNLPHFINSTELENKLSDVSKPINYNALKSYADEGELLTDPDGLAFIEKYAHSTFDLSKFTTVGSPTITSDGIASGISGSNTLKTILLTTLQNKSWTIYNRILNATSAHWRAIQVNGYDVRGCVFCNKQTDGTMTLRFVGKYGDAEESSGEGLGPTSVNIGNDFTFLDTKWVFNYTTGLYSLYYKKDGQGDWVFCCSYTPTTTNKQLYDISVGGSFGSYNLYVSVFNSTVSYDLKQFSITVDGVEVFSGNKTGVDTIKPDDYTVVGTPTISADGIASGFSTSDFIKVNIPALSNFKTISILGSFKTNTISSQKILTTINNNGIEAYGLLITINSSGYLTTQYHYTGIGWYSVTVTSNAFVLSQNTNYWYKFEFTGSKYNVYVSTTGAFKGEEILYASKTDSNMLEFGYSYLSLGANTTGTALGGSIDLNAFKIYVDGDLVYQPCLKIPYTQSKTGSKIVDSIYRDRVNDMREQFGYAPYYTLSNTDFTLPQVELYGLIGAKTLRDSYRNGINYWELYSNRDLEQGGSCTSGVEVTLAKPFSDTNYVLSVPYSAKSSTAFTPTQTGDWIAKGKGVL